MELRTRTLFALAMVFTVGAFAQSPTGGIEGTITDSTNAVVSGASISLTNNETGQVTKTTTSSSGLYGFRELPPAIYSINIEAPGFSSLQLKNVTVTAGSVVTGSGVLQIGSTATVVEVAEQGEAVDTVRQTVDTVITTTEIKNLPLFSRNFLDLATLAPGTTVRDGGQIDPTKSNAYRTVGIAGRSGTATRVQIDGVDITDETVGTTLANISNDAVSQFELQRSSLDPSTSLTSSGAISIIGKAGSNELHGTAFFDYTNQDMQAREEYLTDSPDNERKRYGAGVGGAFIKNKLFGYGNLEKSDATQGQSFISSTFPSYNATGSLPLTSQYATGRLDWNISTNIRAFYQFLHSDDLSTGGSVISPYQNIDWTNFHILGLTVSSAKMTHDFRFGYVNFNNHIDSSQLSTPFPNFNGVNYLLNISNVSVGPNGLAPQQTYQDNYQWSYEGSYFAGKHSLRYGVDVRRIILGGFANFAGPLTLTLQYDAGTIAAVKAAGLDPTNPANFPLQDFTDGPNAGYFTVRPAHNLPHGGHYDTRTGAFFQDSYKIFRTLTVNYGVRWQYDSDYFADPSVKRDPAFDLFLPGASKNPEFPKDAFSPSFGFAWDVTGKGKTVIRGGFYKAYEMNIFNNTIFDEYASIPSGIGPDTYSSSAPVRGPDGNPIVVAGFTGGNYSSLVGQSLSAVLPVLTQMDTALKSAYATYNYNPNSGIPTFENTGGATYGAPFGGDQFHLPYSLQFNLGVEQQLHAGLVFAADFVYNHGVGVPFTREDYNFRRRATNFDAATAQSVVNKKLGGLTVDQYIAANPSATIGTFGLASDAVFPGPGYPDFIYGRFITGGFSRYRSLQLSLRGRPGNTRLFRDNFINVAYARSLSESTGTGSSRGEFVAGAENNNHPNDLSYFGPTALDFRHILTIANVTTLPGGFRINSLTQFHTAPPINLFVPDLGTAGGGSNYLFTTDLNGDGGNPSAATRPDLIPGLNVGQFGRDVSSFADLNKLIDKYNSTIAGKLTPAGQQLVSAGIFTEAQMIQLGAVANHINPVDPSAPNPFHSAFTTDVRLDRPVHIGERWNVTPYVDFINIFNHNPMANYGGLGETFGAYNFDYTQPGQTRADLANQTGRISDGKTGSGNRKLEFGIRLDF